MKLQNVYIKTIIIALQLVMKALKDYENLAYNINVVRDIYPELSIKVQKDSIDQQSLIFLWTSE